MPNQLDSVTILPGEVVSGGNVQINVRYQATAAGDLEISCSGSFSVSPALVSLTPSAAGTKSFALTVTRTSANAPHECMLHFIFSGDERRRVVEVN
jgi:hypothetical protein